MRLREGIFLMKYFRFDSGFDELPYLLYADQSGRIIEHPYLRMAGLSGKMPVIPDDLLPMPEYSKLFFLPDCPPLGIDPENGELEVVTEMEDGDGKTGPCFAVAAFPEPGFVRTLLPAAIYDRKNYTLPMWAYTAVGYRDGKYWIAAFRVEDNPKWDPRNYDDKLLLPSIKSFTKIHRGPLTRHLVQCATVNHCFAAKNLFLRRWEAPIPVSRKCNASCLGCLSLQPHDSCEASHSRIGFRPSADEIVSIAVEHLERAPEAMVSFGQGCEGEPLTEDGLIAESIRKIRLRTAMGSINLNTNGGYTDRLRTVIKSGLDSVRISLNSARPELYCAYYRPRGYGFSNVVDSIKAAVDAGIFTMINYLVFPGITDQPEEVEALKGLIVRTGIDFVHLKNLCIDPELYLRSMAVAEEKGIGMAALADLLKNEFPRLEIGYFNKRLSGRA